MQTSTEASAVTIRRLVPGDAGRVVDCFRRVYGDSYANDLFYDPERLAEHMAAQRIGCVGALTDSGDLLGHMAMTRHAGADTVELGNTVVDPAARGQGLAWRIGAALTQWSLELGYTGYLHYPTTDHHVMQRQSVKAGFEVGLMLGYIPAETDARMRAHGTRQRQAATIVYERLNSGAAGPAVRACLPDYGGELIRTFASAIGLARDWQPAARRAGTSSRLSVARFEKRGLLRISVQQAGADLGERLQAAAPRAPAAAPERDWPCRQIDFRMADPGIHPGVEAARRLGYRFCGWLPGFGEGDRLRLQWVDEAVTDLAPDLVNPVARTVLAYIRAS